MRPERTGEPVPALQLSSLSRRFGALKALREVTLEVAAGARHVILGANGAGKTTLFNIVTGELPPSAGRILLFGREITRLPVHARARLGLRRSYQQSTLFNNLSVVDNLFLAVRGVSTGRFAWRRPAAAHPTMLAARELARSSGLDRRLASRAADLSHGEQRQLEIGMTLAGSPRLILLDEPAAGLSPAERQRLVALLQALPAAVTLLMIEHDMDVALTIADRVTVMHQGSVLTEGTAAAIADDQRVHDVYMGRHAA